MAALTSFLAAVCCFTLLAISLRPVTCQLADLASDYFSTLTQGPFKHSIYLDADQKVKFKWSAVVSSAAGLQLPTTQGDGSIQGAQQPDIFVGEISAPATGYIGFGLSPNGGMAGADIILMWVDDATGKAYAQKRYAKGNYEPEIDHDRQNTILAFDGQQNETHTTFKFARLINASCYGRDDIFAYNIESFAMRIIYSYSDQDPSPVSEGSHAQYHGPNRRGVKTLYLLDDQSGTYEQDKLAALRDTTEQWEFKANKFEIPAEQTRYQCQFHKFPQIERDVHIIGFEPMVDPQTIKHVHHFAIRLCDQTFVGAAKNQSTESFNYLTTDPEEKKILDGAEHCMPFLLWAWSVGGSPMYMPRNVGYRLRPEDSNRWFILETHYDNPTEIAGMKDSSGVRFLVRNATDLRAEEARQFYVAACYGPEMVIPTARQTFSIPAVCTAECTQRYIPKGGVTIFAVYLHSHLMGKAIVLRHFRSNKASAAAVAPGANETLVVPWKASEEEAHGEEEIELPPVAADPGYDFNYQTWRPVNVTLLPGDRFVVECNYTSAHRNTTSYGGEATKNEMCMAFLFTTPPADMVMCGSSNSIGEIIELLGEAPLPNGGTENGYTLQKFAFGRDGNYSFAKYAQDGVQLEKQLENLDWTAENAQGKTKYQILQDFYHNAEKDTLCRHRLNFTDMILGRSKILDTWRPYQAPRQCGARH